MHDRDDEEDDDGDKAMVLYETGATADYPTNLGITSAWNISAPPPQPPYVFLSSTAIWSLCHTCFSGCTPALPEDVYF